MVAYPAGAERRGGTTGAATRRRTTTSASCARCSTRSAASSASTRGGSTPPASRTARCSPTGWRATCPGTFAAIAPVAGAMPADLVPGCAHTAPVSVVAFQGTADPLDAVRRRRCGAAARAGALGRAERRVLGDGRRAAPRRRSTTDEPDRVTDGTRVRRTAYGGCREGRDGRALHHRRRRAHLAGRAGGGAARGPGDPGDRRDQDDLGVLREASEAVSAVHRCSASRWTTRSPLAAIARRAETLFGDRPVVSRRADGSLHRTT